jgi:hypothetical protein
VAGQVQELLTRNWAFEVRRSEGRQVIHAVQARYISDVHDKELLNSLHDVTTLCIHAYCLTPEDIRSLVANCPSVETIEIGWWGHQSAVSIAIWPELLKFPKLKHVSVQRLQGTASEVQTPDDGNEDDPVLVDSVSVAGNLTQLLPTLLHGCRTRSLRVELRDSPQRLTPADHGAINGQSDIESLEIVGDLFGGIDVRLDLLPNLDRLERLTLRRCRFDPNDLHCFTRLKALTLQRCYFLKHGFDSVLAHPTLQELELTQCDNEGLRFTSPLANPETKIRTIRLRYPLLEEIESYANIACTYDVELGHVGRCVPPAKHNLQRFGLEEVATLKQLERLRSVSLFGGFVEASEAALLELSRVDTLRRLKVQRVDLVEDATAGCEVDTSRLEEVSLGTDPPMRRALVSRFLGPHTRHVVLSEFKEDEKSDGEGREPGACQPEELGLVDVTLPLPPSSFEHRLLCRTLKTLTLDMCTLNKGAIQQVVTNCPALETLVLEVRSIADERELWTLNELSNLKRIELRECTLSATTLLGLHVTSVRFGEWKSKPWLDY